MRVSCDEHGGIVCEKVEDRLRERAGKLSAPSDFTVFVSSLLGYPVTLLSIFSPECQSGLILRTYLYRCRSIFSLVTFWIGPQVWRQRLVRLARTQVAARP